MSSRWRELKRTLLTDSWAHRSFAAYLTMVEQSLGQPVKKLVIVGDDLGTVMKWIALERCFWNLKSPGR